MMGSFTAGAAPGFPRGRGIGWDRAKTPSIQLPSELSARRFALLAEQIGACAAQIRRIHGEILASNFHRGSSKLPISAMTFLAVVERAVLLSLSVGAKSSSARGGAVAAHILVP